MSKTSGASNKREKIKSSPARSDNMPAQAKGNDLDFMIALGKFKIDTGYFELIESKFEDIYPVLLEDVAYTPEELCGEELWADLTGGGQRQAVFCLRHMAQSDDYPLIEIPSQDCGSTTFQVIEIDQ
jgi:hypothetical protein